MQQDVGSVGVGATRSAGPAPWGWVAWLLPPGAILLGSLQVNDLAYQLRAGSWMWEMWKLLSTDIFTFTVRGAEWLNQQWGAQLLLSGAHAAGGWRGLILLQAALVAAAYGTTYRITLARRVAPFVAACLTVGGFAVTVMLPGTLALRPQLLALPMFVTSAWLIRTRSDGIRRLLFLPPIGVVWVNAHGSFVLLTVLIGIAFASDLIGRSPSIRWTGVLLLICLLLPIASPWGLETYAYLIDLSSSPIVRDVISEWRPITERLPGGLAFLVAGAGLLLVLARYRTRPLDAETLIGSVAFTLLAIWSSRNVLWWGVYIPPVAGGLLAGWEPGTTWPRAARRAIAASMVAILMIGIAKVATRPVDSLLTEDAPGLSAALRRRPGDDHRVFANRWASWIEFAAPGVPLFVDARVEMFPDEVWADYFTVVGVAEGWQEVLARWEVDTVVVEASEGKELIAALDGDPGWERTYRADGGVIFERRGRSNPRPPGRPSLPAPSGERARTDRRGLSGPRPPS